MLKDDKNISYYPNEDSEPFVLLGKIITDYIYSHAYQISEILFFLQTGHYKYVSKSLLMIISKNLKQRKLEQESVGIRR
jgi:hypothetical protein